MPLFLGRFGDFLNRDTAFVAVLTPNSLYIARIPEPNSFSIRLGVRDVTTLGVSVLNIALDAVNLDKVPQEFYPYSTEFTVRGCWNSNL